MNKTVFVFKCYSKRPETKDLCLFEVITCETSFAIKEIENYCINKGLTTDDYYVKKSVK